DRVALIGHPPAAIGLDALESEASRPEDGRSAVGAGGRMAFAVHLHFEQRAAVGKGEITVVAMRFPNRADRLDTIARKGELAVLLIDPDRCAFAHVRILGLLGEHVIIMRSEAAPPCRFVHARSPGIIMQWAAQP